MGPKSIVGVQVAGLADIPLMGAPTPPTAVVLNVTVATSTAGSNLTVWPSGASKPLASDLNYVAGQTVPNLVVVQLGADGTISLYNAFGTTDVVIDVVGLYSRAEAPDARAESGARNLRTIWYGSSST